VQKQRQAKRSSDQTEDLKKFDVPTLVIQGDDDQIVPFTDAGALQAKLVKGAALKVYKGAPHGLCTTHKDQVNEELLTFCKAAAQRVAWPACGESRPTH
jgi:non-heme chloroperoxidase